MQVLHYISAYNNMLKNIAKLTIFNENDSYTTSPPNGSHWTMENVFCLIISIQWTNIAFVDYCMCR